jgi:LysM repeat protein
MKKKTFLAALALGLATASEAQMLTYLMVDNVCSRKQDYQLTKGSGVDFYDFYVQMPNAPEKRLTLRIPKVQGGLYVSQVQNLVKDAEMLQCDNLDKLTNEMVDEVNRELKVLQVVEKTATGYTIYQVKSIATYEETATGFAYKDLKINFSYQYNQIYKAGENLSETAGKVMFQDAKKENCVYRRTFKSFGVAANELPISLQFVENIGLVKLQQGGTDIELKTVNTKPINAYLSTLCASMSNGNNLVDNGKNNPIKTESIKTEPIKTEPNQIEKKGGSTSLFGGTGEHIEVNHDKKVVNNYQTSTKTTPQKTPNTKNTNGANLDINQLPRANEEILKAEDGYHIVQEGDNVYNLSLKYGSSVEAIMHMNNMADDKLKLNQKLKVVDDGQNSYKDNNPQIVEDEVNKVRYTVHIVHQGDNLGKIAQRYNTNLLNLFQLNNLQDDKIAIKQQIVVNKEMIP